MITCSECGAGATARDDNSPWCPHCSIWLVHCDLTGQWVGPATRQWRLREAAAEQQITASRGTAEAALPETEALLPAGWRATVDQGLPRATYALRIRPASSPVDVTAHLSPPHDGVGWFVQIHNRTTGIGFPLYTPGGAHAAYFTTITDAVTAAINAIRIEQEGRY